jgi:hypothetical protein
MLCPLADGTTQRAIKVDWFTIDLPMVADLHVAYRSAQMAEAAALLAAELQRNTD